MFDIGAPELFIVAVLAIIVVGPKDLPKLIRSVMGMVKKVREMGSEFQQGVKKMADEVELDAITRKLNEAGNISLDDVKTDSASDVNPSAEFSDYDEFDYDEYDYDNGSYNPPDIKEEEKPEEGVDSVASEETPETPKTPKTTETADETVSEEAVVETPEVEVAAEKPTKKVKSKSDV
ncbi:MAG: twin-arginine translocase subunit TatB [Kordiimonadaceae bacterium]|jgi:sec-independent protein translocase protein TatB|nr:twin-arginine translocase subunit TatB [Kordiimonadaceae bacterium]MBT6032163.1 twin-arginine translocase subunit TatB [Kordiimonadaceae bacterium]